MKWTLFIAQMNSEQNVKAKKLIQQIFITNLLSDYRNIRVGGKHPKHIRYKIYPILNKLREKLCDM
jgi:hypothetical protein